MQKDKIIRERDWDIGIHIDGSGNRVAVSHIPDLYIKNIIRYYKPKGYNISALQIELNLRQNNG